MIGKYFSNGWKNAAGFSNDWKNFSAVFQRLEKFFGGGLWKQKGQKGKQKKRWTGVSDNYDNC